MYSGVCPCTGRQGNIFGSVRVRQQRVTKMTLPTILKPASTWLPLQIPAISICLLGCPTFWLFHYYMYRSGGVAFMVLYVFTLIFLITPLMFIELRLGGITQRGLFAMQAKYFPVSTGVGLALLIRLTIFSFVAVALMCIPLWYMFVAGTTKPGSPYPWSTCSNPWNTPSCAMSMATNNYTLQSPEEEYFRYMVTETTGRYPELGRVPPHLGGMLVLSWIFIFLLICGGPRIFGWLVLIFGSFFITGLLILLGIAYGHFDTSAAAMGLKYVLYPNFEDFDFEDDFSTVLHFALFVTYVWSYLLPSVGKMAGKGPRASTLFWIPILFTVIVVPFLVSIMISGFFGLVAEALDTTMSNVMAPGLGMVYYFLPTACGVLDLHPGVAFLLFALPVLLISLSEGLVMLVVVDSIMDEVYGRWLKGIRANRALWRLLLSAIVCAVSMLLSLPLVTQNGQQLLLKIDWNLFQFDFVYFGMMLASLVIIYAQRKQLSLIERIVVIVLVCLVGAVTGLSRMAASIMDGRFFELDNFAILLCIGPLVLGLPLGLIYAILNAKGPFEQRLTHLFVGNQDDSDISSQPASAPGCYQMVTGQAIHPQQQQQQQRVPLIGGKDPVLMEEKGKGQLL